MRTDCSQLVGPYLMSGKNVEWNTASINYVGGYDSDLSSNACGARYTERTMKTQGVRQNPGMPHRGR